MINYVLEKYITNLSFEASDFLYVSSALILIDSNH